MVLCFSVFACAGEAERVPAVSPPPVEAATPVAAVPPTDDDDGRAEDTVAPASVPAPVDSLPPSFVLAPRAPQGAGADVELFRRAQASRAAGSPEGIKEALLPLVRDHPTSPLVPHAFFLLGEQAFAATRWQDALRAYDKSSTFAGSEVVPFARHRIAWCRVKLGADDLALESFVATIGAAKVLRPDDRAMLVRASVLDSTGSFARTAKLGMAREFYRRLTSGGEIDLEAVLARVAEAATDAGRRTELAEACRADGSPRWCTDALARP